MNIIVPNKLSIFEWNELVCFRKNEAWGKWMEISVQINGTPQKLSENEFIGIKIVIKDKQRIGLAFGLHAWTSYVPF